MIVTQRCHENVAVPNLNVLTRFNLDSSIALQFLQTSQARKINISVSFISKVEHIKNILVYLLHFEMKIILHSSPTFQGEGN